MHATQPSPVVVHSRNWLYTAVKVFMAFRWTKRGNKGRGIAGSPLSQFEQRADEITQVVVAGLTNEHRDGDENDKTSRATFCLLTHRRISTCESSYGRKRKLIYILHYIISSSLSAQSPMNTPDYIGTVHHSNA